jgi:hypothetical protein
VYSRVYPPNNVPILLQFWFPCMHGSISSTTAYTNHSTCDRYLRKYQGTIGRYKTTKFESEILQPADGERNPHCLFIYLRLSICVDLAKVYNVERVTPKLRTVQSSRRLSPMSHTFKSRFSFLLRRSHQGNEEAHCNLRHLLLL